jgi:hypothetical protein
MVSMLGPGQPVVDSDEDDRPAQTDWPLKDVGAWTKLVVCVGLGIALGAVNLAAVGAPGMLRIPAFLTALILCAQGPVDLGEYQREKEATISAERIALKEWEERQEARQARLSVISNENVQPLRDRLAVQAAAAEAAESKTETETRLLNEQAQKQDAQARIRAGAVAESRSGLVVVAILAIWLGLATLNYPQSPPLLLWLSLVASFLLFVSVWGGLQGRPAGS